MIRKFRQGTHALPENLAFCPEEAPDPEAHAGIWPRPRVLLHNTKPTQSPKAACLPLKTATEICRPLNLSPPSFYMETV